MPLAYMLCEQVDSLDGRTWPLNQVLNSRTVLMLARYLFHDMDASA